MAGNLILAAKVDVPADLVKRLLAGQHPDLARLPVRFLANGWDNAMFRVGDELLARMPRREYGAAIIAHEQRWLPLLAARLPIPIPYPERMGVPAHGYPWPWSIVPYLPGQPAAGTEELDVERAATTVGGFLGALHAPAPADAPVNQFRGMPLSDRAEEFTANLRLLSGQVDEEAVRRVWADAIAAPRHAGPPAWLHGDLHPANILVREGLVSGVIDFGHITSGDPAVDLSVAWMLLPVRWHGAFREAYEAASASVAGVGVIDDGLWTRARGWALSLAVVFLAYCADNPQLFGVGRRTLHAVLAEVSGGDPIPRREAELPAS
jgi:aminoglycoside phosphotransferase (APT) family kinase protein